jgi:alkaline phosphatase D
MRRNLILVTVIGIAVLVVAPASPASATRGFNLGVAASEVSARSAILWAKSARRGPVTLEVRRSGGFGRCGGPGSFPLRATKANDLTVQKKVGGLKPNKRYRYRFCRRGGQSAVGRYKTAPAPNANATVRFAWSGDQDATRAPGTKRPLWNNFEVLDKMRSERNQFNILMGDWIYSDNPPAGLKTKAISVPQKWAKYRQNLAQRALQRLRTAAGTYNHWDDHVFVNDFSPNDTRADLGIAISPSKLYRNSVRAFRDYAPVTYSKRSGIYRSVRWGKNLELFFLDERSFRSAKADTGAICDNPAGSGDKDIAPTAPQSPYRDTFGAFIPQLQLPVSASCLAEINDPSRTMLGARQLASFKQAVSSSTATFKVIMSELPIQQYYAIPYDRWEGYESERDEVLNYLKDNVENVVFLSGDQRANLVNDARTSTLEAPGVVNTGILDVTTGPIATASFEKEIDDLGGGPGFGEALRAAFLSPAPPTGVGMQCAALNVFSYGEVTVSSTQLKIDLRDSNGASVREGATGGGATCPQIVITA